jgi:integrase
MPSVHLTQRAVERLQAPDASGKQTLYWDAGLTGLAVLCSGKTGVKTYVVQRDINGRSRRVSIGPTNVFSLDAARKRAKELLADFYQGLDPKAGRRGSLTLRAALEAYLAARKDLRPSSITDYRTSVERYLKPWLDTPLREITPDMVEARHRSLQAEIAAGGRYTGYAAANSAMQSLRVLWNFAVEREPNLPLNPVGRIGRQRQWFRVERRTRMVRFDELPQFCAAVMALPNAVQRDYLLLLLFTGLRRSEAATLTWYDIDFGAGIIRLPATRTKAGRKLDLPMSDFVRDLLVARRALGRDKYIFPSTGGHITEPKFPLATVAKATGIQVSAHDLRRTYVTVAESCDISVMALKALVNHSMGSDVTGGYVQMTPERLREPAQKVADKIKALCGITAPVGAVVPLRG